MKSLEWKIKKQQKEKEQRVCPYCEKAIHPLALSCKNCLQKIKSIKEKQKRKVGKCSMSEARKLFKNSIDGGKILKWRKKREPKKLSNEELSKKDFATRIIKNRQIEILEKLLDTLKKLRNLSGFTHIENDLDILQELNDLNIKIFSEEP